jgi:ketosteroid isomerase-like protein
VSEENVEIIKLGIDAWNAGDMDWWGSFLAPDVIWRPTPDWPEPGPYVGREAVLRQARQLRDTSDGDIMEPITDFLHTGDRVAVRFVWRGQGHGPSLNVEMTCLHTVRDGKVVAFEYFWIHNEALKAMGLEE